ncbi:MAG: DUF2764 domain-containing protein [Candidatus Cloacimonetes bacterium]|nr:DUF2764 domain-containing protein [Candidatus Cloacimonadota bacterium]
MHTQYYYFITGLPVITFEDNKIPFTPDEFLLEAEEHLVASDFQLLRCLRLPEKVIELLNVIYNKEDKLHTIDEENLKFYQDYKEHMKERASEPTIPVRKEFKIFPDFLHKIITDLYTEEEMPPYQKTRHKLLEATYEFCSKSSDDFLKHWFNFNRDMQNIIIAINGRAHNIDYVPYLIGEGELVEKLAKSHSLDFGLGKDNELFESIYRIWEQNNILYREKHYDILRWKWIDEFNFFNYFNIERILGYDEQLRMLNRWIKLDPTAGKEVFKNTIDTLSKSFTFPEQFKVKSTSKK